LVTEYKKITMLQMCITVEHRKRLTDTLQSTFGQIGSSSMCSGTLTRFLGNLWHQWNREFHAKICKYPDALRTLFSRTHANWTVV